MGALAALAAGAAAAPGTSAVLVLLGMAWLVVAVHRWRRARYWAAYRAPDGRPVRLLPALYDVPGAVRTMLRFAWAAYRGVELEETCKLIDSTPIRTCRLDATTNDHAFVLTGDPEVFAWVTVRNADNYVKGSNFIEIFHEFLGEVCSLKPAWPRARAVCPQLYVAPFALQVFASLGHIQLERSRVAAAPRDRAAALCARPSGSHGRRV